MLTRPLQEGLRATPGSVVHDLDLTRIDRRPGNRQTAVRFARICADASGTIDCADVNWTPRLLPDQPGPLLGALADRTRTRLVLLFERKHSGDSAGEDGSTVAAWPLALKYGAQSLIVARMAPPFGVRAQDVPASLFAMRGERLYIRSCVGAGPGCEAELHALESPDQNSKRRVLRLPGNAYDGTEFEFPGSRFEAHGNASAAGFVSAGGLAVSIGNLTTLKIGRRIAVEQLLTRTPWPARLAALRSAPRSPIAPAGPLPDFPEFSAPDTGNFAQLRPDNSDLLEIFYAAGVARSSSRGSAADPGARVLRVTMQLSSAQIVSAELVEPPRVTQ